MITIVDPESIIISLWSRQAVSDDMTFRMMRYVLRVDCDDKVLLHNVVTGQLVVLDTKEVSIIDSLPTRYSPAIKELVMYHFLVPDSYDEHDQVVKLRTVLRQLYEKWEPKTITKYTILPTTACNARCYYCFEQGAKISTMTESVANDVVAYITGNYKQGTKVIILWFGGEPTVAANRIDQISEGLTRNGVDFSSRMMSNGYLLDEKMVKRAKELWHLTSIKICFDGDKDTYNQIKAYETLEGDSYEKVMSNIGYLLDAKIQVSLRMNFDVGNYDRFMCLVEDIKRRFGLNDMLGLTAHPIIGEYRGLDGKIAHGDDEWLEQKTLELNQVARIAGLYKPIVNLPHLEYKGCSASRCSAITITPEGNLVKCLEQFGREQSVGSIYEGIVNQELVQSWRRFADYNRCIECVMFPMCAKLIRCAVREKCYYCLEYVYQYTGVARKIFKERESALYDL